MSILYSINFVFMNENCEITHLQLCTNELNEELSVPLYSLMSVECPGRYCVISHDTSKTDCQRLPEKLNFKILIGFHVI